MIRRSIGLFLCVGFLAGCDPQQPSLTDARPAGKTLVPAPQARGLFRHVCLSSSPKDRLNHPFVEEGNGIYRHADFDLRFFLDENSSAKSCTMVANLREIVGKLSGPGVKATNKSKNRVLGDIRNMKSGIQTNIREDGRIVAKIASN